MKINNSNRGFIVQGVIALVALVLIGGGAYYATTKKVSAPKEETVTDWKTYTNTKDGYTFEYPTKLSLTTSKDGVSLIHSIPFENTDGGCDMVGNAKLSKTLGDFNVLISVAPGQIKPPYVDGTFSEGTLKGDWAYSGAEGCGQTVYYFPISGNRTLIVTKQELQVLSPVVAPEVRNKVLAVPGVISYEESNKILKEILSTFKFTSPASTVESKEQKLISAGKEVLTALKNKDYKRLEDLTSKDGISFNEYPDSLDLTKNDVSRDAVSEISINNTKYMWGYTDGKGDEIKLTLSDYINKWIYNHDYLNAPEVVVNTVAHPQGNTPNNIQTYSNGRNFVAFHYDSFNNDYAGMDWTTIYLIFDEQGGEYKLRGIVKANWTI